MRDYHVWLVTDTFGKIADRDVFVTDFFNRLFITYPHLQPLFENADLKKLNKKVYYALTLIVTNLRNPQMMRDTLHALGERHMNQYGVMREYFPLFGEMLLDTLADQLGPYWNDNVRDAWQLAFDRISSIMLDEDAAGEASA